MSHSDFCICCKDSSDLVSVHEELSLQGYICPHNSAAALVDHCFNIKIVSCEVSYAMCSTCVSKVVQSCMIRDQIVQHLNSTEYNRDRINIQNKNRENAPQISVSKVEEESKPDIITSAYEYEDFSNSHNSLDDPSFMSDYEKWTKQQPQNKAAGNNQAMKSKDENKVEGLFSKEELLNGTKLNGNSCIEVNAEIKLDLNEVKMQANITKIPVEIIKSSNINGVSIEEKKTFAKKVETTLASSEINVEDDKLNAKSEKEILKDEFEFLLMNCEDFGLFSWYRSKYKCLVCNKVISDKNVFKIHALEHTNEDLKRNFKMEPFFKVDVSTMKCCHCGECATELDAFRSHLSVSHNIQCGDLLKQISAYNFSEDEFKCGVCSKCFRNVSSLTVHINEHTRNYLCPHCGKFFNANKRLQRHINNTHVTKTFKCTQCDETFKTYAKKEYHMGIVHSRRRQLCQHCPETFKSLRHKLRHLAETHNEELRRYKCQTCPSAYITSKDLSRHVRKVHLQERNHACSVCGTSFFSPGEVKDHMVIHTGKKTFQCQICHKTFARRGNLTQHMRVHKKHL